VRPKKFVPQSEWAKLALYILAMDLVADQLRMKLESNGRFSAQSRIAKAIAGDALAAPITQRDASSTCGKQFARLSSRPALLVSPNRIERQ
jgi:hypothetical protein